MIKKLKKLIRIVVRKLTYMVNLSSYFHTRLFHDSVVNNGKHFEGGRIKFYSPSFRSYMRSIDAHIKEPMTKVWIENMSAEETLWDIGANVGVFTLLAAYRGVNVVAFEPLYSNYFVLSKNIELNPAISSKILALSIALSNKSDVKQLYIPDSDPGYSGSSYGLPIDQDGKVLNYNLQMNMLGLKGDDLNDFLNPPWSQPTHIKLDVDGIEDIILLGLEETLSKEHVCSVLVESSLEYKESHNSINDTLKQNGFSLQQSESTNPNDPNSSCYNYIFIR